MKTIIGALSALTLLFATQAIAAVTDDEHDCKFTRGQEGIDACNRLFDVDWGTNGAAWIYYARGTDHLGLDQYSQALADLTEAIKEAPEFSAAFANRAVVYEQTGKLKLAKADLDTVIGFHTSYLMSSGGNPRANHYLATSQDIARMSRAKLEVVMGDIDDAVTDADTALKRAPNNAVANSVACWVHAIKGDKLDAALDDCNSALDMTSDDPTFLFRRGFVHYRMNDFADAIKDLDQATILDGKFESALYVRGLAKAKAGDAAGSKADIDAAVAIKASVAALFTRYGITP